MNKEIKKDILQILQRAIEILKVKEEKDLPELEELSNHTIHDASIYQDIDSVSIAILLYSLYKILPSVDEERYQKVLKLLTEAKKNLEKNNLKKYNSTIASLFELVKEVSKESRFYIKEVIKAAKIKKASLLFKHGLSLSKAAEIIGLNIWELRNYIGQTKFVETTENIPLEKRVDYALSLFEK